MKKFNLRKTIISILAMVSICSMFAGAGCVNSGNESGNGSQNELYNPSTEDNKQTLSIDAVKEVELGDTVKLTVYSANINTNLTWTSSDESVVTVDNGLITAVKKEQQPLQ